MERENVKDMMGNKLVKIKLNFIQLLMLLSEFYLIRGHKEMDTLDRKILEALQQDARRKNADLAINYSLSELIFTENLRHISVPIVNFDTTKSSLEKMNRPISSRLPEMKNDTDLLIQITEEFYDFNDSYVWNLLQENQKESNPLGELISRFRKRKRLKMVKEVRGISASGKQQQDYSKLIKIQNSKNLASKL